MAAAKSSGKATKPRRSKKKSRTDVSSSSSDSDSDVAPRRKTETSDKIVEENTGANDALTTKPSPKKAKSMTPRAEVSQADSNFPMSDAPHETTPAAQSTAAVNASQPPKQGKEEDFGAIYLRKVAAELADDLDKVRNAPDFKDNSLPILIGALKQGESCFSNEEKGRVVSAATIV